MESVGIVKSIHGPLAVVLVEMRGGCCEHCEKETCDIDEKGVETEAVNEARAQVGQKVKVVMKSHTYLRGALILYVLPVCALFIGAVVGKMYLPAYFQGPDSDLLAAFGGFSAFFLSLIFVKLLSNRMDRKIEYKSVIESIIES